MKYLKVFTDFAEDIDLLSDVEVGRLFRAMLLYAENGQQPSLNGNEKFLWGAVKKKIDAQRDSYDQKCDAAKKAIEARWSKMPNDTDGMPKNTNGMPNDAERIKTKTKTKTEEQKTKTTTPLYPPKGDSEDFARFWDAYPQKTGKGAARASYERALYKTDPETILAALEAQKKSPQWCRDGGQYIPHPATWLNQERWQDEVQTSGKTVTTRWEGDDLDKAERMLNGRANV